MSHSTPLGVGDSVVDASLSHALDGYRLAPGTLADQLGESPTLLVFLRHYG